MLPCSSRLPIAQCFRGEKLFASARVEIYHAVADAADASVHSKRFMYTFRPCLLPLRAPSVPELVIVSLRLLRASQSTWRKQRSSIALISSFSKNAARG